MHIAMHIGAHCTGSDLVVRSLRRNLDRISPLGIVVPETETYHAPLRDAVNGFRGAPMPPGAEDALLDSILRGTQADRLILSNTSFLCVPDRALEGGALYPLIHKARWLRDLFPSHEVSFHLCLRDMATFLPALFRAQRKHAEFGRFLDGADLAALRWSEPVRELLDTCPDCTLSFWCYEDSPLIWEEVMRSVGGIAGDVALHGLYDMAAQVMERSGMARLRAYVDKRPPRSTGLRQKVTAAFIDAFAIEEALHEDRPTPAWDADLCDRLTRIYETDLAEIVAMDRVTAITR
ncbi:hypothetical protein [Palleronia rufa]|uniref:hypothetical protein n=1 Tax=Palleronia rufa TaxID=1530186 RepID=UPI00055CF6AE|nr:hypothetical protein [Palleronia rufa]